MKSLSKNFQQLVIFQDQLISTWTVQKYTPVKIGLKGISNPISLVIDTIAKQHGLILSHRLFDLPLETDNKDQYLYAEQFLSNIDDNTSFLLKSKPSKSQIEAMQEMKGKFSVNISNSLSIKFNRYVLENIEPKYVEVDSTRKSEISSYSSDLTKQMKAFKVKWITKAQEIEEVALHLPEDCLIKLGCSWSTPEFNFLSQSRTRCIESLELLMNEYVVIYDHFPENLINLMKLKVNIITSKHIANNFAQISRIQGLKKFALVIKDVVQEEFDFASLVSQIILQNVNKWKLFSLRVESPSKYDLCSPLLRISSQWLPHSTLKELTLSISLQDQVHSLATFFETPSTVRKLVLHMKLPGKYKFPNAKRLKLMSQLTHFTLVDAQRMKDMKSSKRCIGFLNALVKQNYPIKHLNLQDIILSKTLLQKISKFANIEVLELSEADPLLFGKFTQTIIKSRRLQSSVKFLGLSGQAPHSDCNQQHCDHQSLYEALTSMKRIEVLKLKMKGVDEKCMDGVFEKLSQIAKLKMLQLIFTCNSAISAKEQHLVKFKLLSSFKASPEYLKSLHYISLIDLNRYSQLDSNSSQDALDILTEVDKGLSDFNRRLTLSLSYSYQIRQYENLELILGMKNEFIF